MQTLFFPFTHVTDRQVDTLVAFFSKTAFLGAKPKEKESQTICRMLENQTLERIEMDEKMIRESEQKSREYMDWAKIHKGNEHNLKAVLKENAYFTSDTHVHSIKSQIRGTGGSQTSDDSVRPSALPQALLFLNMAQMCDEQNEQIDHALHHVDVNKLQLFEELKGEPETALVSEDKAEAEGEKSDSGLMLTQSRVLAWFECFTSLSNWNKNISDMLFVTTSPAVFEWLETKSQDVTNALDIDQIKVHENSCKYKKKWQQTFVEMLGQAAVGREFPEDVLPDETGCCNLKGRVKLNIFSGGVVNRLLDSQDLQLAVCLVNLI